MARPPCSHCRRCPVGKSRRAGRLGLCVSCFAAGIGRAERPPRDDEPTEADLDALIAEQRANLPPWWKDHDPDWEPRRN